jgi:hypothetical protein
MAIPQDEQLLTLAEAAATLPRRRAGRPTHASTLFRWSRAGLRGVRLEIVQVGATKCTSREALARFFAKLTRAAAKGAATREPARDA